jgi:biotin carboxyl carrier protein
MAKYKYNGKEIEIKGLKYTKKVLSANIDGERADINVLLSRDCLFVEENGVFEPVFAVKDEKDNLHIHFKGETFKLEQVGNIKLSSNQELQSGRIETPMPGKILELKVKQGDKVDKNQTLLLMESMKLQVEIKAPFNGIVKSLNCEANQMVNGGELLAEVEEIK